jgi:signal transduction histidine kinase
VKSLSFKLTLAFLLVGLTGAVLAAVFVRYRTRQEFDRLVMDQNQQALVANLTRFYLNNGSWSGVERAFRDEIAAGDNGRIPERWAARRALFAITDAQGNIVFGGEPAFTGRKISPRELRNATPIQQQNETIGWLVFIPQLDRWRPGTAEGDFLRSISAATALSAIIATAIALALGGVLAYSMTRPLLELTAATRLLAKGKLGYQVKVRSQDEIGVLAESFNEMSTELAHATELRRKMTADIAHDLRTPLSVMLGYTEALSDGKLQPTPEMFNTMHSEAQHLSRLVDDLRTLSLADAGELPLVLQQVEPEALIQRMLNAYQIQADQAGITLSSDMPARLPSIRVDMERMVQVMGNLMNNALRYTPAGGKIELCARESSSRVELQVSDNGPGIPAEDLPYIFERSFRGDKTRQQHDGESGLGLAIARSLVEAQGGRITVASEAGQGTTFIIAFPG